MIFNVKFISVITVRNIIKNLYLNVGQDLLADSLNQKNTYSYNVESTLADKHCTFDARRRANARELLLRLYHQKMLKENVSYPI